MHLASAWVLSCSSDHENRCRATVQNIITGPIDMYPKSALSTDPEHILYVPVSIRLLLGERRQEQ